METDVSPSPKELGDVIDAFLNERMQPRLEKAKDDRDQIDKIREKFKRETWISDAARRVSQIQQVTHAIKFTNPEAKGTSIDSTGSLINHENLVGTHCLERLEPDVVGNAAALDVYKFLRLECNGTSLLELAEQEDQILGAAFSSDKELALEWMRSFATITDSQSMQSSHRLAKQVYWPIDEGEYHLLQPLFPTSFTHKVWNIIRDDRFSDAAKTARDARRDNVGHDSGYCEYLNLVVQKFGGSKPQNISQLNSQRYGENYLLPSLPPDWQSESIRAPLGVDTVFSRWFGGRSRVYPMVNDLKGFLEKTQTRNTVELRDKRSGLVSQLTDEVLLMAAEIHTLPGGWSDSGDCRLNESEQFWLDPNRAKHDKDFASRRNSTDWQYSISDRFGNWLNAQFNKSALNMGQVEQREWKNVLAGELNMIRAEVAFDDQSDDE